MTTLPAPDVREGATTALRLIEIGPRAVYCTNCAAAPGQPCRGVEHGHHRERQWMVRNQVVATLRHHLELPTTTTPKES